MEPINVACPEKLDPAHWQSLLALGSLQHYVRGQVLFEDRGVGDHLYVIVAGPVELLKDLSHDEGLRLGILEDGALFGERCLFGDRRRSAKARAYGDLQVIAIRLVALEAYLDAHPDFALSFYRFLCERFSGIVNDLDSDVRALHLRFSFT